MQSGYEDGIWHRKMHHDYNEKQKTTNGRRNRTTKSIKINIIRLGEMVLGNIRSGHYRTSRNERKY